MFVTVLVISITTLVPSQASTAVGRVKANGVPHSTIWSCAQVRLGGVVSTIVIVWLQNVSLVQVSYARHVRRTVNSPGQRGTVMFVVVLVISITTLVPSHASTAVGRVKANGWLHSTIWLSAQVRFGGVVSTMVIVWLQNVSLVQVSYAR